MINDVNLHEFRQIRYPHPTASTPLTSQLLPVGKCETFIFFSRIFFSDSFLQDPTASNPSTAGGVWWF